MMGAAILISIGKCAEQTQLNDTHLLYGVCLHDVGDHGYPQFPVLSKFTPQHNIKILHKTGHTVRY